MSKHSKSCKCSCKKERYKTEKEIQKKIEELKKKGYEQLPDSKYDIY